MPPKAALSAVFRPPIDGIPFHVAADDTAQITAGEGQSVSPATQLATVPVSAPALTTVTIGSKRLRDNALALVTVDSKRLRDNGTLAASSSSASAPLPYTSTAISKERIDEIIKFVIKAFGSPSADNFKRLLTELPNHLNSATIEAIHNVFKNQFAATLTGVNAPRRRTKKEIKRIHHINNYLGWRYNDAQRRDRMTPENRILDEHLTEQITLLINELTSRANAGRYPIDYELADKYRVYTDYLAAHPEITTFDNDPDNARIVANIYALIAHRYYISFDIGQRLLLSHTDYTRPIEASNRAPGLELIKNTFYPQRSWFTHPLIVPNLQSGSDVLNATFNALVASAHAYAMAVTSPLESSARVAANIQIIARTTGENAVSNLTSAYSDVVTAVRAAIAAYKCKLLFNSAVSGVIPKPLQNPDTPHLQDLSVAYPPIEDLIGMTTINLEDEIITVATAHLHAFDAWIRREQIRKAAAAPTSSSSLSSPAVAATTLSSVPTHACSSSR